MYRAASGCVRRGLCRSVAVCGCVSDSVLRCAAAASCSCSHRPRGLWPAVWVLVRVEARARLLLSVWLRPWRLSVSFCME